MIWAQTATPEACGQAVHARLIETGPTRSSELMRWMRQHGWTTHTAPQDLRRLMRAGAVERRIVGGGYVYAAVVRR